MNIKMMVTMLMLVLMTPIDKVVASEVADSKIKEIASLLRFFPTKGTSKVSFKRISKKKTKVVISLGGSNEDKLSDEYVCRVLQPKAKKDSVVLIGNNRETSHSIIHLYDPVVRKTREILSRDKDKSFFKTDFTYRDLEPLNVRNYTFANLDGAKCSKENCEWFVLAPTEKAKKEGITKLEVELNQGRVLKVKYYDNKESPEKTLYIRNYDNVGDEKIITKAMLVTKDSKTLFKQKMTSKKRLPRQIFRVENISKFY